MGGTESLNNKLCKCQCSFLRRNSFQLTKRQQDHQQMRVLCAWHKHGGTEGSSLKIYLCISPTVQSLFLCSYPNQSQPAQHAQTAPLSRIPQFTLISLTSKPRTQHEIHRLYSKMSTSVQNPLFIEICSYYISSFISDFD